MNKQNDVLIQLGNVSSIIECGIHSGFPPCCIRSYVIETLIMSGPARKNFRRKIEERAKELGISWGYIPCNECLKIGHVVKVLPCPKNSHCFFINESPDVPAVNDIDRTLAFRLQGRLTEAMDGFKDIRQGASPCNGGVAALITMRLTDIMTLITAKSDEPSSSKKE